MTKRKTYHNTPVWPIIAGVICLLIILAAGTALYCANESNNYKLQAFYAFGYAEESESIVATYNSEQTRLSSRNTIALYEQTTSGSPLPVLFSRFGDAAPVTIDFNDDAGHTMQIYPAKNGTFVVFTFEGKTRSYLVRSNSRFDMICRIVSPSGLGSENYPVED